MYRHDCGPHHSGGVRTDAVGSHLDLVPTTLALPACLSKNGSNAIPSSKDTTCPVSSRSRRPTGRAERNRARRGALYTYDMIATIDGEWLVRNRPHDHGHAAAEAVISSSAVAREEFLAIVQEIGTPDPEKRELFRGLFDGRYKLVRYFGLSHCQLATDGDRTPGQQRCGPTTRTLILKR